MAIEYDVAILPKPSEDLSVNLDAVTLVLKELTGEEDPSPLFLDTVMEAMGNQTTVAAFGDDGQILSIAGLRTGADSIGTILNVATRSTARGEGLGRRVIGLLETIAEERGVELLTVEPFSSAAGFYEKLGFEEYGDQYVKVIK